MLRKYSLGIFLLIVLLTGARSWSWAQDQLEKNLWYNKEKTAKIKIYRATDNKYYGKIVWLKIPEIDGKPKVDAKNPDKARQNDPILGLIILKSFKKEGEHTYEDGTIYDPKEGKTYSCKMTVDGEKIHVRGYIGFSLIGKTQIWTKAD